jgi:hypothetical protein
VLQNLPLVIHIHLNLFNLLFLQVSESPLLLEILLDGQTAWFMIEGVSLSVFHFVKGKDIGLHGEDGQFRRNVRRGFPACRAGDEHMNELRPPDAFRLDNLLLEITGKADGGGG